MGVSPYQLSFLRRSPLSCMLNEAQEAPLMLHNLNHDVVVRFAIALDLIYAIFHEFKDMKR